MSLQVRNERGNLMMIKKIKIIVSVFILASVISYFLIDANEKQFDQTQWNSNPLTRYAMTKDIINSQLLIGKTKEAVIVVLGKAAPSTLKGKEHLVYTLGTPPSFFEAKKEKLVVIFENNLVIQVIHSQE